MPRGKRDRKVFLKSASVSFFHFSLMKQLYAYFQFEVQLHINAQPVAAAAVITVASFSSQLYYAPSFTTVCSSLPLALIVLAVFSLVASSCFFPFYTYIYICHHSPSLCIFAVIVVVVFQYLSYKPLIPSTNTSSVNATLSNIHSECILLCAAACCCSRDERFDGVCAPS